MLRKPRFFLPDIPVHSREPVFFEDDDYHCLGWLREAADRYCCDIPCLCVDDQPYPHFSHAA